MANVYRVAMARRASEDLKRVYDYFAFESPDSATAFIGRRLDGIDSLELMPNRGSSAPEAAAWGRPLRQLVIDPYRVVYAVDEAERVVTVLQIIHGARLPGVDED